MKPFTHNRKQKGAFLVLFAVLLPVFLLLVALVSEIGRIWAYHTKLQNAADAAALAGAANFVNGDTIDSHPNADLFADRYVTANLGHNLASSPNLQQFQAKTKAATGSEGEKSYYRVHLEEEIPLIQATAAWLHRPTFLVKATAVALIGKEGTSGGGGIKLGNLATIGSWFDGSFYNNNGRDNDDAMLHQNKIEGAVFDGDIIIWNWQRQTQGMSFEDYYINNPEGKFKFFSSAARGLTRYEAEQRNLYQYPSQGNAPAGQNPEDYYNKMYQDGEKAVRDAFNSASNVIPKEGSKDLWLNGANSESSYYRIKSDRSGNLNLHLQNYDQASDSPIYLFIDDNLGLLHIFLEGDVNQPVIISYFGHPSWNQYASTNVQFENKGKDKNNKDKYYNFRGSLYMPGSQIMPFNFEKANFSGSIYADAIQFQATSGNFKFEEFSLPGGGGGSGTPAVKPRLVDNSLW